MLVLDASVTLSWLFERETPSERKRSAATLAALENRAAVVPALWQAEVVNGLLVGERRKLVLPGQSAEFLARLSRLPIATDSALPASRQDAVMQLGRHYGLTAYDATYLELAMRVASGLATFDRHLAKAANEVGVEIV